MAGGFTKIDNQIIDDESITGYAKLVYLVISRFKDQQGKCWPSVSTIAKRAGISERQVRYGINLLREKGYLITEFRAGKSNLFILTPAQDAEVEEDPCTGCSPPLHRMQRTPAPPAAEQDLRTRSKNNISMQKKSSPDYSEDFLTFWGTYPKKEGKSEAFKTWRKLLKEGFTPDQLIEAGQRYANQCERDQTERKFIKKGVNFLRHRTFEDYLHEPEPEEDPTKKTLERLYAQSAAYLGRDESVL